MRINFSPSCCLVIEKLLTIWEKRRSGVNAPMPRFVASWMSSACSMVFLSAASTEFINLSSTYCLLSFPSASSALAMSCISRSMSKTTTTELSV